MKKLQKRCIGWTVRKGVIEECGKLFTPSHANKRFHSKGCYEWTWSRRGDGLRLGDAYVKGKHRKQHPPKPCAAGWVIRDGVIAKCTEPFTRGRTDKRYHSGACFFQTRRWRELGYHLGDSVRRKCAYRNCKKGPGGTRNTFDRIHRSLKSGDYFCDQRCRAGEQRARVVDELAKLKAGSAPQPAKLRPRGHPRGAGESTKERIALAASLAHKGISLFAMKKQLFPEQSDAALAYANVKKLFRRYAKEIEAEKQRLATLAATRG